MKLNDNEQTSAPFHFFGDYLNKKFPIENKSTYDGELNRKLKEDIKNPLNSIKKEG